MGDFYELDKNQTYIVKKMGLIFMSDEVVIIYWIDCFDL